jgi:hypothetical protein
LFDKIAAAPSDAKKTGQLRNNDMCSNASQESGYHWCRQQVCDPAELKRSCNQQHRGDQQGEGYGGRSDRG